MFHLFVKKKVLQLILLHLIRERFFLHNIIIKILALQRVKRFMVWTSFWMIIGLEKLSKNEIQSYHKMIQDCIKLYNIRGSEAFNCHFFNQKQEKANIF